MLQTPQRQSLLHRPRVNPSASGSPAATGHSLPRHSRRSRGALCATAVTPAPRSQTRSTRQSQALPEYLRPRLLPESIYHMRTPAFHTFQQSYPCKTALAQRERKTYRRPAFQSHAPASLMSKGRGATALRSQQSPLPTPGATRHDLGSVTSTLQTRTTAPASDARRELQTH